MLKTAQDLKPGDKVVLYNRHVKDREPVQLTVKEVGKEKIVLDTGLVILTKTMADAWLGTRAMFPGCMDEYMRYNEIQSKKLAEFEKDLDGYLIPLRDYTKSFASSRLRIRSLIRNLTAGRVVRNTEFKKFQKNILDLQNETMTLVDRLAGFKTTLVGVSMATDECYEIVAAESRTEQPFLLGETQQLDAAYQRLHSILTICDKLNGQVPQHKLDHIRAILES